MTTSNSSAAALLSWLELTAVTARSDTANARVLALALDGFRRRQPLGLPSHKLELVLAAVTLRLKDTTHWEEERIAAALVDLLIKTHQMYRALGFEYAEDALVAYAQRLTLESGS